FLTHFFQCLGLLFLLFPTFFVSGKIFILAYHYYFVTLTGHIAHNVDQFFISGHHFFEHFSQLRSIARFTNKNIMNNYHNYVFYFLDSLCYTFSMLKITNVPIIRAEVTSFNETSVLLKAFQELFFSFFLLSQVF